MSNSKKGGKEKMKKPFSANDTLEQPEQDTAGENYPFPHNVDDGDPAYAYGILPKVSADEMNSAMLRMYNRWKEVYLTTEGCNEGELRVSGGKSYKMGTCSEGTGYGMLLSVYMANSDNNAHGDFDAIYRFVQNHLIPGCGLMKWVVDRHCKDLSEWSAPDGDLDIAFALLMAHKQWGSDGEINYLEEGKKYVQNILDYAVNRPQYTIARAQLTNPDPNDNLSNTMTSYQMPGVARLFEKVTEDEEWSKVVDAIYALFDYFHNLNDSGLPPYMFMIDTYEPVSGQAYDYSYDSCRVPWRVVMDYVWYGADENRLAHDYPTQMATWFNSYMKSIDWDFNQVGYKFNLDGTPAENGWPSPRNIVGMMAPAAMADESNQELLNNAYAYLSSLDINHDDDGFGGYYQDTLAVLGMLAITGNMPNFYEIDPHPENKMLI